MGANLPGPSALWRTCHAPEIAELVEVSRDSRRKPRPVRAVAELAAAQDGVVGHDQLIALGFSRAVDPASDRDRAGFTSSSAAPTPSATSASPGGGDSAPRCSRCGPRAMLSHRSAVRWHNLKRWTGGDVHVTVPGGGREDRQPGHRRPPRPEHPRGRQGRRRRPAGHVRRPHAASTWPPIVKRDDARRAARGGRRREAPRRQRMRSRLRQRPQRKQSPEASPPPLPATPGWTRSRLERRAYRAARERARPADPVRQHLDRQARGRPAHRRPRRSRSTAARPTARRPRRNATRAGTSIFSSPAARSCA